MKIYFNDLLFSYKNLKTDPGGWLKGSPLKCRSSTYCEIHHIEGQGLTKKIHSSK